MNHKIFLDLLQEKREKKSVDPARKKEKKGSRKAEVVHASFTKGPALLSQGKKKKEVSRLRKEGKENSLER